MPIHHPQHRIKKVNPDYIDSVMSVVAIVSPLTIIPQIVQIYTTKDVEGISLITWIFSVITSTIWVVYGFHHKDKPIIFNSIMGAFFCSLIAIGVFVYRK
jgi:uncharacterized protein with PQ loop repeat